MIIAVQLRYDRKCGMQLDQQSRNLAQVALEAGNSPQMIFKHYRELVRPKEAETWFAIVPHSRPG